MLWPYAFDRLEIAQTLFNLNRWGDLRQNADQALQLQKRWPDDFFVQYQVHRTLLWDGRVDAAAKVLAGIRELPLGNVETSLALACARQGCAEGRVCYPLAKRRVAVEVPGSQAAGPSSGRAPAASARRSRSCCCSPSSASPRPMRSSAGCRRSTNGSPAKRSRVTSAVGRVVPGHLGVGVVQVLDLLADRVGVIAGGRLVDVAPPARIVVPPLTVAGSAVTVDLSTSVARMAEMSSASMPDRKSVV